METIRKISIILFFACTVVSNSYSQDWKKLQDAFNKSYTHEYKAEYSKAIDDIKAIYDEKSYPVVLRLGWLNYLLGQYNESVNYYQKAINIMPYSIEAKLGYISPATALGKTDDVIRLYKEILDIDSKNSLINYKIGSIYYEKKDYHNALKYLQESLNQYPLDYNITILYAWITYYLGKFNDAKILFNKALLIKPSDSSALDGLKLIK
ncbi:MAG: tetratricopeptide repeat protein [Bacteroidota bacterium]|nr:tetratricopeptide repeat protein [Bacteroidota bacterium]